MINWKEKILTAQPITEFPVIDCHNHLGKWRIFHIPKGGTIDQMISTMDRLGVGKCFITAHASIGPDYVYGNDMVADAMNKYPERAFGYVTVNPNYPEDIINELERCFVNKNFRGIKVHQNQHGRATDYCGYTPMYEYANKKELPVLIHVWGIEHVAEVERLAKKYPYIRFIMGHTGATASAMEKAIKLINNSDNVYGDTALSMAHQGNIEWLLSEANPKRILYGSDMPYYSPLHTFCRIALAEISDEIKQDVFGANFRRLLDKKD